MFKTKLRKLAALFVFIVLAGSIAVVGWREWQWAKFNTAVDKHQGTFVIDWKGPHWVRLRGLSHRNGFRGFYVVKELYLGASPSEPIACLPPDGLTIYQLGNSSFDDVALNELLQALPTPDAVDRVELSNCKVTPAAIRSLQQLDNLSYVLWVQPNPTKDEVNKISQDLPFDMYAVWPGDCLE